MRPTRPAARMRRATRSTRPTTTLSRASGDPAEPESADCAPNDRRRRARPNRSRVARPGEGVEVAPESVPEDRDQGDLRQRGELVHLHDADPVELCRGGRADAPEPLDRQRVQERELALGRDDEQSVGLGHGARDLGERIRPRDADGERQADPLADVATQAAGDLLRRAADPVEPADVEERLVDRQPLDRRGGSLEDPRTPPGSPRCRPTSAAETTTACGQSRRARSRPSPSGRRTRAPRSSPRAPRPLRRSPAGRAGGDRRAARPTRRRRRGRRAGSSLHPTRTYVRICGARGQADLIPSSQACRQAAPTQLARARRRACSRATTGA